MADEATYEDKNTIALIDLIVDVVVEATLAQTRGNTDDNPGRVSVHPAGDDQQ